jgi:hypothetical protein
MLSIPLRSKVSILVVALCMPIRWTAALSEQCDSETKLLKNNTAILSAVPMGNCDVCTLEERTSSCTAEFSLISGSANFEQVCVANGGQVYLKTVSLHCKITAQDNDSIKYRCYHSFPNCLGVGCSVADIKELAASGEYGDFEQHFESTNFDCESSGVVRSMVLALGSAVSLLLLVGS